MPQSVRLGHLHEQEDALFTDREQKLVNWLWKRKTATMRQMRRQFQVSPMTVFRALKKHGYHTRYNHNAADYTLADSRLVKHGRLQRQVLGGRQVVT
jgi:DeoR/GlpR family transcriptional regulator of sugar metabolism